MTVRPDEEPPRTSVGQSGGSCATNHLYQHSSRDYLRMDQSCAGNESRDGVIMIQNNRKAGHAIGNALVKAPNPRIGIETCSEPADDRSARESSTDVARRVIGASGLRSTLHSHTPTHAVVS